MKQGMLWVQGKGGRRGIVSVSNRPQPLEGEDQQAARGPCTQLPPPARPEQALAITNT